MLNRADPRIPSASPLFADPAGLPLLLIQVGTAELLLSDSEGFAAAARAAGVDVTLSPGEAAAATDEIAAFLRKHLG
ncbi:alpha/beta hydrolase fold domain-containing protein [Nocardia sp. NPDC004860]|uniref:alpha/beta hydrolase fold domain-containing protein n=1 Tax=Nocardia sp. NPDC004860 TaxID=3154557 RepID=UPI0033B17730